jgi:hypothetical protein
VGCELCRSHKDSSELEADVLHPTAEIGLIWFAWNAICRVVESQHTGLGLSGRNSQLRSIKMATKHAANTGKQNQTGHKQVAGKHQDVQPEAKNKKLAEKQTSSVKEKTVPADKGGANEQEEHRDERDFVGQMDGAQANKEMEGHAPYDHSRHGEMTHPEDFDRSEGMREKTKAGSLPIENEHRARDHAGRRHQ